MIAKSTVAKPSPRTGGTFPTRSGSAGKVKPAWNPTPTNAADLPLTVQHQTFTHPIKFQGR